jgi:type IX secretion system PorP/SprF family membrane protein
MKKYIPILILFALSQNLWGQQEGHYTNFMWNKMMLNPAFAGAREVPYFTALHRSQWIGFEGAPQSQIVHFSSPIFNKRVGIGGTFAHTKIGLNQDLLGKMAYSYDLIGRDGLSVRIGLQASLRNFRLNFDDITKLNLSSVIDETIINGNISRLVGNFGAGIYGSYQNKFFAGVSVPNLIENNLNLKNTAPDATVLAKVNRHAYGMIGGSIHVADQVDFNPQMLIKYVKNAPLDADFNATLEYDRKFGIGASYRLGGEGRGESADLLTYFRVKNQFVIGASYDFTLTQIKDYSTGSFEVLLQADLRASKNQMSNPRFFF